MGTTIKLLYDISSWLTRHRFGVREKMELLIITQNWSFQFDKRLWEAEKSNYSNGFAMRVSYRKLIIMECTLVVNPCWWFVIDCHEKAEISTASRKKELKRKQVIKYRIAPDDCSLFAANFINSQMHVANELQKCRRRTYRSTPLEVNCANWNNYNFLIRPCLLSD